MHIPITCVRCASVCIRPELLLCAVRSDAHASGAEGAACAATPAAPQQSWGRRHRAVSNSHAAASASTCDQLRLVLGHANRLGQPAREGIASLSSQLPLGMAKDTWPRIRDSNNRLPRCDLKGDFDLLRSGIAKRCRMTLSHSALLSYCTSRSACATCAIAANLRGRGALDSRQLQRSLRRRVRSVLRPGGLKIFLSCGGAWAHSGGACQWAHSTGPLKVPRTRNCH